MPSILKTCTLTHIRSPFAHEHGHTENAHNTYCSQTSSRLLLVLAKKHKTFEFAFN